MIDMPYSERVTGVKKIPKTHTFDPVLYKTFTTLCENQGVPASTQLSTLIAEFVAKASGEKLDNMVNISSIMQEQQVKTRKLTELRKLLTDRGTYDSLLNYLKTLGFDTDTYEKIDQILYRFMEEAPANGFSKTDINLAVMLTRGNVELRILDDKLLQVHKKLLKKSDNCAS